MQLIDTHAHLLPEYYSPEEITSAITEADTAGIDRIINVGFNQASADFSCQLSDKHSQIYAAIGLHPHAAASFTPELLSHFDHLIKMHPKIVAIGEIGLDYHYMHAPKETQISVFKELATYARNKNLPMIIHVREAWNDMIETLKASDLDLTRIVFHCYGGDKNVSEFIIDTGAFISLTGTITFKNYDPSWIKNIPLDKIMLETDCPYLSPQPHRGKTNYPRYTNLIAQRLAELKALPVEIIAERTTENAKKFFKLK